MYHIDKKRTTNRQFSPLVNNVKTYLYTFTLSCIFRCIEDISGKKKIETFCKKLCYVCLFEN